MTNSAALVLANGSIFNGISIGSNGSATGEVVFNTSMTGYQEIITDPSYAEQMVTLTYPHIGNVGCNSTDYEAKKVWAKGLIIRDASLVVSNWRAEESLGEFLQRHQMIAIAEIDTRRLTRMLRDQGAQNACITTEVHDLDAALEKARAFPGLNGLDLAKVVSTEHSYEWPITTPTFCHVVVYDFGVKQNILNCLAERGCKVTVVPAQTPAQTVLAMKPNGVVLSNGPGDPAACDYAIQATKELMRAKMPLFGICLGFQILSLACGAQTRKMKFGHHGGNHPVADVRDAASQRVLITSQNHGFTVDEDSLPADLKVTHRSLFDHSLQGIRHMSAPAFGFQGHPEASPGPHDIQDLFDEFIDDMKNHQL